MANRSKDESRGALLDAAFEIFMENLSTGESLTAALSSVSFPDVTARAGYKGPGIAYYVWDQTGGRSASRRAFEADLLERIVTVASQNVGAELDPDIEFGPTDLHLAAVADGMARSTWKASELTVSWPMFELCMFLRNVDSVNEAFGAAEVASLDNLAAIVELVLPLLERRFLPGFTSKEFVISARSLLHGLRAASQLNPDYANFHALSVEGMDSPVSLYGHCLRSIIDGMTEPV